MPGSKCFPGIALERGPVCKGLCLISTRAVLGRSMKSSMPNRLSPHAAVLRRPGAWPRYCGAGSKRRIEERRARLLHSRSSGCASDRSGNGLLNHASLDIGQTLVAAIVAKGQVCVVQAEQVKDGGVD